MLAFGPFYKVIPRVVQTFAWGPTRFLLHTFCSFKVVGKEKLRPLNKAIFACNHASELDPIVLTAAVSPLRRFYPMFYVGSPDKDFDNSESFGWRAFLYKGWFFRTWGSYPIVRGEKDYEKALASHVEILGKKNNMCIFPEGGMTKDGNIGNGKGGVGYLLYKTGVPVVPVYIHDTYKAGPKTFLSKKHSIEVYFADPIYKEYFDQFESVGVDEYKQLSQKVMGEINAMKTARMSRP